jgi:regulator of protease activity HflC (stomatin/prohibitin superfamily)
MTTTAPTKVSTETPGSAASGAIVLPLLLLGIAGLIATFVNLVQGHQTEGFAAILLILGIPSILLVISGFFVVQPNASVALVFFGKYKGTIRSEGFYWVRPFMSKTRISLRANNVASETIKVNDLHGNPIEIGAVIVWRVRDTAKATFDVEDYEDYINVQIETAVRELAKTHPYESHSVNGEDVAEDGQISLRSDTEAVSKELTAELQMRLDRAGVEVLEARISHLAYALEIASAMLQRQQAAAIISARKLIVEGAVGMVEHALTDLQSRGVVDLDDERRATMVSNLLVVLCSHAEPTPVINAGGLYN